MKKLIIAINNNKIFSKGISLLLKGQKKGPLIKIYNKKILKVNIECNKSNNNNNKDIHNFLTNKNNNLTNNKAFSNIKEEAFKAIINKYANFF